ncbi:MAG TPA: uroporphyrinogen decarboxylase family protein [Thermoguttaceae bacterium]|nr:uroporphyrinogen decarboxylase family protein [Thermoguttaceae bacterium]
MNHRDRVTTALRHETPDHCPMQISFTPEFAARLRQTLGKSGGTGHNPHGGGNPYDLELALDEDMLLTSVGWANSYYQGKREYVDEWGVAWRPSEYTTPFGDGYYTEFHSPPLAKDEAIASYRPPDPNRPELYAEAERLVRDYQSEYWIVGVTVTTIFETAWALRGMDALMTDFVMDPDRANAVLDIPYRYHLAAAKRLVELGVDMIWVGDDVGTQNSMMVSPALWRRFFKPRWAEFFAALKGINPNVKIAYHSDGMIEPIIPDMIEVGLDVLNPVQPASMDPAALKKKYGDKLCFWGSIDEQKTLPFDTPDDVRREVLLRLQTLGKDGGLIIGPTHHVQLDTPLENFWAMVETIRQTPYGR